MELVFDSEEEKIISLVIIFFCFTLIYSQFPRNSIPSIPQWPLCPDAIIEHYLMFLCNMPKHFLIPSTLTIKITNKEWDIILGRQINDQLALLSYNHPPLHLVLVQYIIFFNFYLILYCMLSFFIENNNTIALLSLFSTRVY